MADDLTYPEPMHGIAYPLDLQGGTLAYVNSPARIAVYDDLLSSPRIIDIPPNQTKDFIGSLASSVYNEAREAGGSIPFTVILQVTENFIHARFTEMVVSIFDGGKTIRFTDQGPGIADKEKAQLPGYSSATQEMKQYINGVGSGLPIVKEYLETKNGNIRIEDNLESGAVVTISVTERPLPAPDSHSFPSTPLPVQAPATVAQPASEGRSPSLEMVIPMLSKRAVDFLPLFKTENIWGIKDLSTTTNIPSGSMFNELKKLRDLGIITQVGKKYTLTPFGENIVKQL